MLATALKDVWDSVAGAGSEFNQKWNGMPAVIAKTAAYAWVTARYYLAFSRQAEAGG
ncbi:MAG: hypothetical protein LBT46_08870 [Planctomycetaceae bacterium]|nr:hypothetical protein [Planctomycetaceae bacterium]